MPVPEAQQPQSDRLALLYHLSQTFNSSLDLDEVLNRVMDEVVVATHAERGILMLRSNSGELEFRVARGIDQKSIREPAFQISLSIVDAVARSGQPVLTSDAQVDPRFNMRQSVKILGLRSILGVPLRVKDRILGVVYVDNRIQAGLFQQDDLDLLTAIASSAAIAIENARLYQLAVEQGRLERELQMARQVQDSLLPGETPRVAGWEFVTRWLPAHQVAGDYYDFIPGDDSQMGLVVADVSDKGMPAALFMALTRSIVRASLDQATSPADGITRANRLICADSTSGMFVTLFYASLNADNNRFTYVNAGHNPPLFYQRRTHDPVGALTRLGRTGMALGVVDENIYKQFTLKFNTGDFLVLYTDGVTDALDIHGNEFGLERLEQVVLAQRAASAAEMVAELEKSIQEFVGNAAIFDDITIVIVKRL
jgi:sigma-B regulation protein RsbU (phosphoserine phosphatase)